jgi:hypothetical protein
VQEALEAHSENIESDLCIDVEQEVVDEYFEIYVEDNLEAKVENLPYFLLKELTIMQQDSDLEIELEKLSDEQILSLAAFEILKNQVNQLFDTSNLVDFRFYTTLVRMVNDSDQILEILANIEVPGLEIDISDQELEEFEGKIAQFTENRDNGAIQDLVYSFFTE